MKTFVASLALVALSASPAAAQYMYYYLPPTGPTYYVSPTPPVYAGAYGNYFGHVAPWFISPVWQAPAYSGVSAYAYRYSGMAGYVPAMSYYAPYVNYGYYGLNSGAIPVVANDYLPRYADAFVHDYRSGGGSSYAPAPAAGTALITLEVRPDAVVTVQGQPTKQVGSVRTFVTPEMSGPGSYTVVVKWNAAGKEVEQKHTLDVRPGARAKLTVLS